eukprot:m.255609 g.255609  ORF g.255609 m.255609 type:complete len:834 (+) comp22693_c0_seq6:72-2573(+)
MSVRGSQRTARLVRELCERSAKGQDEENITQLYHYALRILSSHLAPSVAKDELHIVDLIKKQLARDGHTTQAVRFSDLHRQLSTQSLVKDRWAVLLFLFNVSQDASRSERAFSQVEPVDSILMGKTGLPALRTAVPRLQPPPTDGAGNAAAAEQGDARQRRALLLKQLRDTSLPNTSPTLAENALLQDLLFVFQGVEGKYMKYNAVEDAFVLDSRAGVSLQQRDLCRKLAEVGWLFQRIRRYIHVRGGNEALGLVGQGFCGALQQELTEYYRLLAILENETKAEASTLTLRRLVVWTYDPLLRMRLLAGLVDCCAGVKGGALASAIFSFSQHGDPYIQNLVDSVLQQVVQPLKTMLQRWLMDGQLYDPYGEFFIAADVTVPDNELWHNRYSVRRAMLPAFVHPSVAHKILLVGKSINFVRSVCGDRDFSYPLKSMPDLDVRSAAGMTHAVDAVHRAISTRLLETLHTRFHLGAHLLAVRRYLLLGQGDFILHLMDLLEPELSKPASTLFVHNLSGVLESAVRSSNVHFENVDVLQRLDIKLLEASPGDYGWDVFSLCYHVDGALGTIFSPDCMRQYLEVFNLLWRGKRMEFYLSAIWSSQMAEARSFAHIAEMAPVLHQSHTLRADMVHFISQIQYYFVFEVLECAWDVFMQEVHEAVDLDALIHSHQKFLGTITSRALLDRPSQAMLSQLRSIFDLIIKFKRTQENIGSAGMQEVTRRSRAASDRYQRTAQGGWAETEGDTDAHAAALAHFTSSIAPALLTQVKTLRITYEDMVSKFLTMLTQHSDPSLRFLSVRVDFNEHYRRKFPEYNVACSPARPRSKSAVAAQTYLRA